jgi:glycosyltransferase involved in cell wall biosynthesis
MSVQNSRLDQTSAACWIGGARYTHPLNATNAARWQALSSLNRAMYVIGFAPGLRPVKFTEYAHFYLMPQFPTPLLRYLTMFTIGPLLALWLIFRHDVGILISQSPYEGAAAAFAKHLAKLLGKQVKLIVESHGDFEDNLFLYRKVSAAAIYRPLMRSVARYTFSQTNALRAVSSTTRQQLERWTDKPVEQFTAWTHTEAFLSTPRSKPPSQTWDVIYAGSLTPLKGVHLLVEAFARISQDFPQARLLIIGKTLNSAYVEQLKAQIEKLSAEKITLVGEVSQAELGDHMRRGRVVVLPSSSEGMPRVIIEALMCGTPVIATRVGGVPDVIEDGINGLLIPPGDVAALTDALRRIFHDIDVDAMGEQGKAKAARFFSADSFVEGYRRLLALVD